MTAGAPVDPSPAAAAVADAYVWGYPLVAVHRVRSAHRPAPGGGLAGRGRLSTAADRAVVAPNNDTLYATGWFDLTAGDVIVDVEPMDSPDRYWSVMLLDAYTHVAYVCRRLHGTGGAHARVTLAPERPPAQGALDVVPIATPTLWVLARVLVAGPGDLAAARAAQARIRVHQPSAPARGRAQVDAPGARAGTGDGFLDELRDALAVDPPAPWHPPLPPAAAAVLDHAPPAPVVEEGIRLAEARMRGPGRGIDRTGNGWGTRSRGADFGGDVSYRAAYATFSLAGHLPAENRSYSRVVDAGEPVVLRFPPGGEPPVDGFWSLSVYGPDMFFVDNPLGRYSIGDRTPGLRRHGDGSLAVTIGNRRPADVANWLPAPAGPCVLALRAYEGRPEVVDASWFPPDVTPAEGP
ncbi:MAG TPA: DUF1254 domain-containing protein [Acidimicrobiales bacterium]